RGGAWATLATFSGIPHEIFVLLEECLKTSPELPMRRLGASHIRAGESQAFFDFSRQRVLEGFRVRAQTLAVRIRRVPCTQYAKSHLGWCEVGLRLLDNA